MTLPILETPMHSCVLPSSNKRVQFRPFLVGEQKILMIAQESDDQTTQVKEMIRLINVCTPPDVNAEQLPTIDLEYLFLQIRIKSVGETSEITMNCDKCETENSITVDLEAAKIKQDKKVSNIVKLTNDISLELQFATYEAMKGLDITTENTNTKEAFQLMQRCIVAIIQGDNIHTRDDFTEKELTQFMDSMSLDMFEGVQEYLASAPTLSLTAEFKCKTCENQQSTLIEGIGNFFV
jgi:hypothetical protein